MAKVYPPPEIDRLLSAKVAHDALRPSYEEMATKARDLGLIIMKGIEPQLPKDVFDVMCIMPRGGFLVNDVLTHAFDFHGRRVQTLGTTSYMDDGRTKSPNGVIFTQLPAPEDIQGQRVLLAEDVCDTGQTFHEGKKLLLAEPFNAQSVTTAAIYYKPDKSKTGFIPDYFVEETDRWIVFPGEVYEQLGMAALNQSLWRATGNQ
jgi:hypoxanthine phosphoribosyltransferase